MKDYKDCDYTFFFSYSSKDNDAQLNWIDDLYAKISQTTEGHLPLSFEYKNGSKYSIDPLVTGKIDDKLTQRMDSSFAYIAIVGDNYLESEFCNLEFDYISKRLSQMNADGRAFIIAMTKNVMRKLEQMNLGNFVINKLYDKSSDKLMDMDSKALITILKTIGKEISNSIEENSKNPVSQTNDVIFEEQILFRLGIIPVTHRIQERVDKFIETVENDSNGSVHIVQFTVGELAEVEDFSNYLGNYDCVLIPYTMETPLWPREPGGLISTICNDYENSSSADNLQFWFIDDSSMQMNEQNRHFEFLSKLKEKSHDEKWIYNYLLNQGDADVNKKEEEHKKAIVYIESNDFEKYEWQSLADCMRNSWDLLNDGDENNQPLTLAARSIDIPKWLSETRGKNSENNKLVSKGDGFVVLWGHKDSKSLEQHIDFIENHTPGVNPPPGIIAYLIPPKDKEHAHNAYIWQIACFENHYSTEETILPVESKDMHTSDVIKHFLKKVRQRKLAATNSSV